ncbi:predicted protein [Plenodomus lingam JN3]|uniref:Predicted protein n=1 Tax=Leptosphaeria maculans (strain JN3 / isolate v23.1.3 / race Av1-4-5-6-7-8) TaxID=985895 RepID=E5A1G5_LEPMJ|nr:predicted protein [Plenodomus lingam JN3]CBX97429.1 predicted protein [Plenodomus lingam JN3]
MTLSAADYHWDSLMRLMPGVLHQRFRDAGTRDARIRVARDADRFEYQARGSAHNYGLYWCDGTPSDEIENLSTKQREHFAKFWGIHIKAIMFRKFPEQVIYNKLSLMSRSLDEMENKASFLNVIINLVQNHCHFPQYCMKVINKETGETVYRFNMPRDPASTPFLEVPKGRTFWKFMPESNNGMLNPYNRLVTLSWLANTDIQPFTGARAVIECVGKYAAKVKKASVSYQELVSKILPFVNKNSPFQSFVSKVMNKLVGERDWSSQQVITGNVNLRPPEQHAQVFFMADDGNETVPGTGAQAKKGQSLVPKYQSRSEDLESIRYIDFCRQYTHDNNHRLRPKAKERVLNICPRYNKETDAEDFARAKLMLHYPWREVKDLLYDDIDEEVKNAFAKVYSNCFLFHNHQKDGLDDDEETFNFDDASQDPENAHMEAQDIEASFAELAAHLPDASGTNVDEPNQLGRRDIDDVDWNPRIAYEDIVNNPDFWKDAKQLHNDDYELDVDGNYESCEDKQKQAYDIVVNHFTKDLDNNADPSCTTP